MNIYKYASNGWRDQLLEIRHNAYYDNGIGFPVDDGNPPINYDNLGRANTHRGNTLIWSKFGTLTSYGRNFAYKYGADGIRLSKMVDGNTTTFYVNNKKIIRSIDNYYDIWYNYGVNGIQGLSVTKLEDMSEPTNEFRPIKEYVFRKNAQGDVTHIYELIDGKLELKAEYKYDAWGNHKIYDENGMEKADEQDNDFIGFINPIRYRGYYYDNETGLYYLNARYYDPQIGRFISADDTSYLDPQSVNGLNLYAYCSNNPVMNIDPDGTRSWKNFWKSVGNWFVNTGLKIVACVASVAAIVGGIALMATGVGATVGGGLITAGATSLIGGFTNEANGGTFIGGWVDGAISGAISYTFSALGMATGLWYLAAPLGNGLGAYVGTLARISIDNSLLCRNDDVRLTALENGEIAFGLSLLLGGMFRFIVGVNYSEIVTSSLVKWLITAADAFYNWAASFISYFK